MIYDEERKHWQLSKLGPGENVGPGSYQSDCTFTGAKSAIGKVSEAFIKLLIIFEALRKKKWLTCFQGKSTL